MSKVEELHGIKERALSWLESMRVDQVNYRMNEDASANIFTSCFALFILDLLGEVDKFDDTRRNEWITYIQSFQNEEYGYFEPEQYLHKDTERNRLQLTCFCLSALGILGSHPTYALKYLNEFQSPQDVDDYLFERNVHQGARGSGNKSMFLGVALSYEYERTGEERLKKLIDTWFDFHDRFQNAHGFWGGTYEDLYYHGFQNGLHQLVVYYYWGRQVSREAEMVDAIIGLQGSDGHFNVVPGGSSCKDFDAVHILIHARNSTKGYEERIDNSLRKTFAGLIANQNPDGGFCQSQSKPKNIGDIVRQLPYYTSGHKPYHWYYRLRKAVGIVRTRSRGATGWTPEGREWNQSNLWETWFRLLTLAEIANSIPLNDDCGMRETKFHGIVGLGYFRKNDDG